jgi:hypothetical protein
MRQRYKVLSFSVLLIAIISSKRNETVAMAKLLSFTNDKDEGIIPGLPMWVVLLMILTATALLLAFLWSSALRAWCYGTFAGATSSTTNNTQNYSEVQLASVDRGTMQSSTMVALLVETGVAPAVASPSEGSGRRKSRGGRGRKKRSSGPSAHPSSESSAVVSTHGSSPQGGGSTSSSNIYGSSNVHNGSSTNTNTHKHPDR